MNMKTAKGYERFGLRVTAYSEMGNRKYMEDVYSVAYQKNEGNELDFAYFGMFDGHGGDTAAIFAKNHLMNFIVDQPGFWSNSDEDVLQAIKTGFNECHMAMWRDLDNWPKTSSNLPSTAGTTASIAFIRKGKLYVGHAGDSGIVLGTKRSQDPDEKWQAEQLTVDHKPESPEELQRIVASGGKVVEKIGIHRVVWYRPRFPHQGPIRRNTRIEEIPFLAVARSLGDLWSYNYRTEKFMVSPEPDVAVYEIDATKHKCLIFASDGLWNIMDAQTAVDLVFGAEKQNEINTKYANKSSVTWINPSRHLVETAMRIWRERKLRSDNTSVVCVMLDVPNKRNNLSCNEQEQNSRTIYDYSTSEAYNLDYVDMNYDSHQNYHPLVMQNSFPYYNQNYERNPNSLPPFSSGYLHSNYLNDQQPSTSADLMYQTSSNECAFVKGCCPNERFLLAKVDEEIHYHRSYDHHKQVYENMAQQPFPPLHYAYRPVPNHSYGYNHLPSINDTRFMTNQAFMSPRPMERYNYLRPTEEEIAEIHNEVSYQEEESENSDTDTEEMDWSDEEKTNESENQNQNQNVEVSDFGSEVEVSEESQSDDQDEEDFYPLTQEPKEKSTSDDSIQIFEISSSNLGINEKSSKSKSLPEHSNNKENSESPNKKKKLNKSLTTGRYYETRQTNCKMRSGNIRSTGVQKTINKEKSQRRVMRCAKKAIKALQAGTSAAIKKIESMGMAKAVASNKTSSKTTEKDKNNSQESRILRSSQTSPPVKKAMKSFKVNVIRSLRSSTADKSPKKSSRVK